MYIRGSHCALCSSVFFGFGTVSHEFCAKQTFQPGNNSNTGLLLFEAWSGVNWADLMAAQGAFGTDFYDRSLLRLKHRAYYRSGRPVIKTGPKGALGSHEIRPIHSTPSLGQSIVLHFFRSECLNFEHIGHCVQLQKTYKQSNHY